MSAKIIGQNHTVISYQLNGRKRFIVETVKDTDVNKYGVFTTVNRQIVNDAVYHVGREWSEVYNHIDEWLSNKDGGLKLSDDNALCNCIESMTY